MLTVPSTCGRLYSIPWSYWMTVEAEFMKRSLNVWCCALKEDIASMSPFLLLICFTEVKR